MSDLTPPLPVAGYTSQSAGKVAIVNEFKAYEERLLRKIDVLVAANKRDFALVPAGDGAALALHYDPRWLAVAKTHFQEGFMALNRAVFQPQRIALPEDAPKSNGPTTEERENAGNDGY